MMSDSVGHFHCLIYEIESKSKVNSLITSCTTICGKRKVHHLST